MTATRLSLSLRHAALAAATCLALGAPAAGWAHAEHGQPAYGGIVAEAGTFQGELVAKDRTLTLYISIHGEPVAMTGGSAKAVVLNGSAKSELTFTAAGANKLTATAAGPLVAGTKAVVTVKLPDGRSGALRFEVK